jgi:alanine dehydrogenase
MLGFEELAQQTALYPQEALAKTKSSYKSLFIGLPKEISLQENRIALTPEAVAILVRNGHRVLLEKGAGEAAKFADLEYSKAGAEVVLLAKEAFAADIVLKVEPVIEEEFQYLRKNQSVVSALNLPHHDQAFFENLNKKNITGICYEQLEDKVGNLPIIRALSEITGSTVMLIAAEYLSSVNEGRGVILGGITGVPPTKVVILGGGTVAEYATRTAIGLGAEVKVFDKHIYRLQRLKYAIGHHIYTSIIETDTLAEAIRQADVVIGAMRAEDGISPCIVTEEMVAQMQANSVIIDVSIDQGGCFETSHITTHKDPTYKVYDVIHYCVPNIASRVARTASVALSNIFLPLLLNMGNNGGIERMMFSNRGFMKGVYCYRGSLTNAVIANKFKMRHKDLSLLLAAGF